LPLTAASYIRVAAPFAAIIIYYTPAARHSPFSSSPAAAAAAAATVLSTYNLLNRQLIKNFRSKVRRPVV
jgi:hypothetical protein